MGSNLFTIVYYSDDSSVDVGHKSKQVPYSFCIIRSFMCIPGLLIA